MECKENTPINPMTYKTWNIFPFSHLQQPFNLAAFPSNFRSGWYIRKIPNRLQRKNARISFLTALFSLCEKCLNFPSSSTHSVLPSVITGMCAIHMLSTGKCNVVSKECHCSTMQDAHTVSTMHDNVAR